MQENAHSRLVGTIAVVIVALWMSAVLAQCVAGTSSKTTAKAQASPSPAGPPIAASKRATVFLLGGSSARESIVSNAAWSKQLSEVAHGKVRAFDLGSRNESFTQDMGLVKKMPKGPTLLLIGVTVGRYTGAPSSSPPPLALLSSGVEVKHQYSAPLSDGRKQQLVNAWVSGRYPVFQQNYAYNAGQLAALIKLAQHRKFNPVLLQLPLNLRAVGASFDPARARYQSDARKLAAKYKIPYVDFVAGMKLPSSDFYDLFHLVPPGRQLWQTHLSAKVAKLLAQDKLTSAQ